MTYRYQTKEPPKYHSVRTGVLSLREGNIINTKNGYARVKEVTKLAWKSRYDKNNIEIEVEYLIGKHKRILTVIADDYFEVRSQ